MRMRPLPVTVAAVLLVLLSLTNFPWLYLFLFPGAEEPPAFILYLGYVVGVVGLVAVLTSSRAPARFTWWAGAAPLPL